MTIFRPASVDQYVTWLEGYLEAGGRITHAYDYPIARPSFLVAVANFTTGGECGSRSRQIIVPQNVQHLGGDLGHNTLYFMDGFRVVGHFVPVYNDPEFDRLPGVPQARAQAAADSRAFWVQHDALVSRPLRGDLSSYTATTTREPGESYRMPSGGGVDVHVDGGAVVLLPSTMPVRLTPEDAEEIAAQLRAAAQGARRSGQ